MSGTSGATYGPPEELLDGRNPKQTSVNKTESSDQASPASISDIQRAQRDSSSMSCRDNPAREGEALGSARRPHFVLDGSRVKNDQRSSAWGDVAVRAVRAVRVKAAQLPAKAVSTVAAALLSRGVELCTPRGRIEVQNRSNDALAVVAQPQPLQQAEIKHRVSACIRMPPVARTIRSVTTELQLTWHSPRRRAHVVMNL